MNEIKTMPGVREVRGRGLMIGVELFDDGHGVAQKVAV